MDVLTLFLTLPPPNRQTRCCGPVILCVCDGCDHGRKEGRIDTRSQDHRITGSQHSIHGRAIRIIHEGILQHMNTYVFSFNT